MAVAPGGRALGSTCSLPRVCAEHLPSQLRAASQRQLCAVVASSEEELQRRAWVRATLAVCHESRVPGRALPCCAALGIAVVLADPVCLYGCC